MGRAGGGVYCGGVYGVGGVGGVGLGVENPPPPPCASHDIYFSWLASLLWLYLFWLSLRPSLSSLCGVQTPFAINLPAPSSLRVFACGLPSPSRRITLLHASGVGAHNAKQLAAQRFPSEKIQLFVLFFLYAQ